MIHMHASSELQSHEKHTQSNLMGMCLCVCVLVKSEGQSEAGFLEGEGGRMGLRITEVT